MGSSASTEKEPTKMPLSNNKLERVYRPPDVRIRDRFETSDNYGTHQVPDNSIDKFDYLIAFPLLPEEGPGASRISWDDISNIWRHATPGTDVQKLASVNYLASQWRKRFESDPHPNDKVPIKIWLSIARDVIIDRLSSHSGLQLKITASPTMIYCRIRAPIKLLEAQAEKESYRLQFKGEVDPGSAEFWNKEINGIPIEIDEEKKIYTRDKANVILEKLYRAGKISPNDLGVNPHKETAEYFSRRIHVLERIADKVPISSEYHPYAAFFGESHMRYLFQTYNGVRGKTLFRAKDRLYLTKAIIDRYYDMEVLQEKEVIESIQALHDANRGESLTIDVLKSRWVTFWRANGDEIGSPLMSTETVTHPWYMRQFCQPLFEIRNYFGEKIAIYYAWLGFYAYMLTFPSLLGLTIEIVTQGLSSERQLVQLIRFVFLVCFIIWTSIYEKYWKRENKRISVLWGTDGFEKIEKERPQFMGDKENPTIRSVITNQIETNFPEEERQKRSTISIFIVLVCILILCTLIGFVFYLQFYLVVKLNYSWGSYICSILSAVQIQILNYFYKNIVYALNEWENYRTETAFEDNLIFKTFLFQIFNNFAALFFTAFLKGPIFDSCTGGDCVVDMRLLLFSIFAIRFAKIVAEIFKNSINMISNHFIDYFGLRSNNNENISTTNNVLNEEKSGNANDEEMNALNDNSADTQFLLEIDLEEYDGTFDDFAEIVLQFGYLCFFVSVMPLLVFLAQVENMLQIRIDAYNLCTTYRRPHVGLAEDVGMWVVLMNYMSIGGIVSNVAILCMSNDVVKNILSQSSPELELLIVFFLTEQMLLLLKVVIMALISDVSKEIEEVMERHQHILLKYIHGFEDYNSNDKDGDAAHQSIKGHLDDSWMTSTEGLTLVDIGERTYKMTETELSEQEALENRRRLLLNELKAIKEQLQVALKSETYNEVTGVGETKHGLPLGRLSVRVLKIDSLFINFPIKIATEIKSESSSNEIICPPFDPKITETHTVTVDSAGNAEFNQSLGPFAPIKTLNAKITFYVIDTNSTNPVLSLASVASASVSFGELQDQEEHVKVIPLVLRAGTETSFGHSTSMPTAHGKTSFQSKVSNSNANANGTLTALLTFKYSKVAPLKKQIYQLQDDIRVVEATLAKLKSGKS